MAKKKKSEPEKDGQTPARRTGGLTGHLKKWIETCGLTPYEIAKRAGIAPQQIYRFVNDGKTLSLETVDKIIPVVDESFHLRMAGVEFARDGMDRTRQDMLGYIGQLEDSIEDLKSLLVDGVSPEYLKRDTNEEQSSTPDD